MSNISISAENAIRAFNTLKYFCKSSDDKCCINGIRCPFDDDNCRFMAGDMPYQWKLSEWSATVNMVLSEEQWKEIQDEIREEYMMSNIAYKTWIKPLKIIKIEYETIYIEAPKEQGVEYIKQKYGMVLRKKIGERTGKNYRIDFVASNL